MRMFRLLIFGFIAIIIFFIGREILVAIRPTPLEEKTETIQSQGSDDVGERISGNTIELQQSIQAAVTVSEQELPLDLEPGATVSRYAISKYDHPNNLSPVSVEPIESLAGVSHTRGEMTTIEGYFLIDEPGVYNFLFTAHKIGHSTIKLEIDDVSVFPSKNWPYGSKTRDGQQGLDAGYHHFRLIAFGFLEFSDSPFMMAQAGKPLVVPKFLRLKANVPPQDESETLQEAQ